MVVLTLSKDVSAQFEEVKLRPVDFVLVKDRILFLICFHDELNCHVVIFLDEGDVSTVQVDGTSAEKSKAYEEVTDAADLDVVTERIPFSHEVCVSLARRLKKAMYGLAVQTGDGNELTVYQTLDNGEEVRVPETFRLVRTTFRRKNLKLSKNIDNTPTVRPRLMLVARSSGLRHEPTALKTLLLEEQTRLRRFVIDTMSNGIDRTFDEQNNLTAIVNKIADLVEAASKVYDESILQQMSNDDLIQTFYQKAGELTFLEAEIARINSLLSKSVTELQALRSLRPSQ